MAYADWTEAAKERHRAHGRRNQRKYREREWASRPTRHCEVCMAVMPPGKRGYTCSTECQRIRHIRKVGERNRQSVKRPMHERRECTVCGASFLPKTGCAVVCSAECHARAHVLRTRERRGTGLVMDEPRRCDECGKVFVPKGVWQVTCSKPCAKARGKRWQRQYNRGVPYEEMEL